MAGGTEMKPFNKLTPAAAERLALLLEECGEVIQAAGKVLRHGYANRHPSGGPTNRESLERELGDAYHAMRRLMDAGEVRERAVFERAVFKGKVVRQYLHHQVQEEERK